MHIDINNKEEILRKCDFDYFYKSAVCERELCAFYNDIQRLQKIADFDYTQAQVDLGRIAITLNQQAKRITDLEDDLNNASQVCAICQKEQENDRLKAEIEAECQEHQEAMRVADKTIRLLAKALELACANHPASCNVDAICNGEVDCVRCLVEYYKIQARKELKFE